MGKTTAADIKSKTFMQLTKEDMFSYIEDNCPEEMKDFMRASYFYHDTVPALGDDGKALMTKPKISKKTGKPTTPRVKTHRVYYEYGSEEYNKRRADTKTYGMPSFDTVKARYYFCGKWFADMLPNKNNKAKQGKLVDTFADKYNDFI